MRDSYFKRVLLACSKVLGRESSAVTDTHDDYLIYWRSLTDSEKLRFIQHHSHGPGWINIPLLRLWLHTCDTEHGDRCQGVLSMPGHPQWLIDVNRLCVVKAKSRDKYIALSYVWGQVGGCEALQSNLRHLRREGVLSKSNSAFSVPQTIRHSIYITRLLGLQFLWVDRLCIVQDDLESKHAQLNEMASIYANAYVTIIAANGSDANHGICGLRGVSKGRDQCENLKNDGVANSVWHGRGWTFQELVFSRRIILLLAQDSIWECSCNMWRESWESPLQNAEFGISYNTHPPSLFHFKSWKLSPWPDLPQYFSLVQDFNKRFLTFQGDAQMAFAGVISAFNLFFSAGFVHGLPSMFFDVALLWQPKQPLRRRVSGNTRISLPQSYLPSWSWVGWQGVLDEASWDSGYDFILEPHHNDACGRILRARKLKRCSTISICQWYIGDEAARQPINMSYDQYKECALNKNAALPAGWSRKTRAPRWKWDTTLNYFTHEKIPEDRANFSFPIQISNATCSLPVIELGPLLFCKTLRGFFSLGTNRYDLEHYILDNRLAKCGVLRLGCTNDHTNNNTCELIAISKGTSKDSDHILDISQGVHEVEFYNVLWIEWDKGVAYRKALGWVLADIWERESAEYVDVTLG